MVRSELNMTELKIGTVCAVVVASPRDSQGKNLDTSSASTASEIAVSDIISVPSTPEITPRNISRRFDTWDTPNTGFISTHVLSTLIVRHTFYDVNVLTNGEVPPSIPNLRRTKSGPAALSVAESCSHSFEVTLNNLDTNVSPLPNSLNADAHPFNPGAFPFNPSTDWAVFLNAQVEVPPWPVLFESGTYFENTIQEAACNWSCTCKASESRRCGQQNQADKQSFHSVITAAHSKTHDKPSGEVWKMCCRSRDSSWKVQEAITYAANALQCAEFQGDQQAHASALFDLHAILRDFHGRVQEAIGHRHGNYVLIRIVESLPATYVNFVAEELIGFGFQTASHRFGCRIVLRLFRHFSCNACVGKTMLALMDEVVAHASELSCNQFGNYVIQEILENGLPQHRHQVAEALLIGTLQTGCHWYGTRIVQKALGCCNAEDSDAIATELLSNVCHIRQLMAKEAGRLVLKSLLLSEQHSEKALRCLRKVVPVSTSEGDETLTEKEMAEYIKLLSHN